jgi:hypothetical protein
MLRIFTWAAIAVISIIAGCVTFNAAPDTNLERICQYTKWQSFGWSGWEGCRDLPEPTVITSSVVRSACPTCYGFYYFGEKYIFVSSWIPLEVQEEVALHETVHYVVFQLHLNVTRCEDEELARKITAGILGEFYDASWAVKYGCEGKTRDACTDA